MIWSTIMNNNIIIELLELLKNKSDQEKIEILHTIGGFINHQLEIINAKINNPMIDRIK